MKELKPSDLDLLLEDNDTDYFETNSKVIPIESASFKRLIKHLTSGVPVMMVSAFTGDDIVENNKNTKLLIKDIIKNELSFIPVNGYWVEDINDDIKPEKSFFVVGITTNNNIVNYDEFNTFALELCNKYKQNCVLIGKCTKNNVVKFGCYGKGGCLTEDEFNKIIIKSDADIITIINSFENEKENFNEYKNGKFVLKNVGSAKIDEDELKNSKATMFTKRMLYRDTKNYGLYYLGD